MSDTYKVTLTPGALSDLDRLDQFLRGKNPSAANRMLAAFNVAFTRLSENPLDNPFFPSTTLRARIVRFGKGGYICLYKVEGRSVFVARLFHAREDWQPINERGL
jgi:plasmid stabilization system protein ParE